MTISLSDALTYLYPDVAFEVAQDARLAGVPYIQSWLRDVPRPSGCSPA
jgi:hypothetical protein